MPDSIFSIQKIYVQNLSFEVPNEFDTALKKNPSENRTEIQVNYKALPKEHHYEVILTLDLINTINHQIAFTIKLEQVGVFYIENFSKEQQKRILEVECPSRLYPYASNMVSQIAVLSGFSVQALQPIDFSIAYEYKQRFQ